MRCVPATLRRACVPAAHLPFSAASSSTGAEHLLGTLRSVTAHHTGGTEQQQVAINNSSRTHFLYTIVSPVVSYDRSPHYMHQIYSFDSLEPFLSLRTCSANACGVAEHAGYAGTGSRNSVNAGRNTLNRRTDGHWHICAPWVRQRR